MHAMKSLFILLALTCAGPLNAQISSSSAKVNCPVPTKTDGAILCLQAMDDGKFLAVVKQGKGWAVQERNGDGGIIREAALELTYEKEDLTPIFVLRTIEGVAVVAEGMDGKGYNQWTALFPLDLSTLAAGKANLILFGKPGAHNRLYDLRPGGAVSPNGKYAVVWRANTYIWYKEPRTYTLEAFDGSFGKLHKWTVKFPDGPGDRFEQVGIDNNGDVYVLAIRDKKPGERKDYGEPSGSRSIFEVLIYKPGTEEPVTTVLTFTEPVGDVAFDLGKEGVLRCHGILEEKAGGDVFTCTLDKASIKGGRFSMSDWKKATVAMKAPVLKEFADMDLETRWQPRIDLADGSSVIVAQYERQTTSNVGSFWAFYDLDLLVVRTSVDGTLIAARLPNYQSSTYELTEPFVAVAKDGVAHILVNELTQNLEPGRSLEWYNDFGGELVEWEVGPNLGATRFVVPATWEKKESRAVYSAIELSDGRVVVPVIVPSIASAPLAKRVCLLTW